MEPNPSGTGQACSKMPLLPTHTTYKAPGYILPPSCRLALTMKIHVDYVGSMQESLE